MGHYCRICGRVRSNEKFSGKGHKTHICKDCQKLGKEALFEIEAVDEIFGFLEQSHISEKNRVRLSELMSSENQQVAERAKIVFKISTDFPYKRRRWKKMKENNPVLFEYCRDQEVISDEQLVDLWSQEEMGHGGFGQD